MADELQQALLEFVRALKAADVRVFLGGGYGLYLRQISLLESNARTYLNRDAWPRPRATADLDVFLPSELVVDGDNMARVRKVLDELRYQPTLEHLHFERAGVLGSIKIELLTGPVQPAAGVKVSGFRVRARTFAKLHAYLTNEAVDLELIPQELIIDGTSVLVPNAFAFLLMKLHAFRDRMNAEHDDEGRQLGRHHALDVYRVIAMLTEPDEAFMRDRCTVHRDAPAFQAAAHVVERHFATLTSLGVLRLREHSLAGDHLEIPRFLELLRDLFRLPS